MNSIETFSQHLRDSPHRVALVLASGRCVTFQELGTQATAIQKELFSQGLQPGDAVLVLLDLSADLFSSVLAILGLGCGVVFVEPWLSIEKIESILEQVQPKAFLTNHWGRLWGLRVSSLRKIQIVMNPASVGFVDSAHQLQMESVDPEHLGILTFTSELLTIAPKPF